MVRADDTFYTYMLASSPYGTLYIGVPNNLVQRIAQHREATGSKFTKRYRVSTLVWFEIFEDVEEAIQREKTMKDWPRQWKINLIERENRHWEDLFPSLPRLAMDAGH